MQTESYSHAVIRRTDESGREWIAAWRIELARRLCAAIGLWLGLFLIILASGCASSHQGSDRKASDGDLVTIPSNPPAPATIYTNTPKHQPRTTQKLSPLFWFGNVDDPIPPPSYRTDDPHRVRKWYWRNSCHNFTFYVMGMADKEFTRTGRCPHLVFCQDGGWNWAVCRYGCVRLPFVSYQRGSFKFYIGWRERGNFGLKLNF